MHGKKLLSEAGDGNLTVFVVCKKTVTGDATFIGRYGIPLSYVVKSDGNNLRLDITDRPGMTAKVVVVTSGYGLNEWNLFAVSFDQDAKIAKVRSIRADNVLRSAQVTFDKGPLLEANWLTLGARSGGGTSKIGGPVAGFGVFRRVLTDAELQSIWNSGNFRTISELSFGPPNGNPPGCPIGPVTDHGILAQFDVPQLQGTYWARGFPVPGGWLWLVSSDHATVDANAGVYGQVTATSDPATVVAGSWQQLIPGALASGTRINSQGQTVTIQLTQMETPHALHVPGDSDGEYWIYAHGVLNTASKVPGLDSGANPQQETHRFTATTPLGPYTARGPAIPCADGPGVLDWTHTGYATIWPPNTLPGVTDWTAYHLGRDGLNLALLCTSSPDGKTFSIPQAGNVMDNYTPFDALYQPVQSLNLIVIGSQVYAVCKSRCINGSENRTSVALAEMKFVNGWSQFTGKLWTLVEGSGPSPGEGYIQDVRAYRDGNTLRLFVKYGLASENGWADHVQYLTAEVL